MHTRPGLRIQQIAWIAAFLGILLAPQFFSLGAGGAGSFILELSLTSGVLAASTLACTILAAARVRSLTRSFGIESVLLSHRWLALATLVIVIAHLALVIAANPANARLLVPWLAPHRAQAATVATLALILLCLLSLFRQRLGTRYESWRWVHITLGMITIGGAGLHVFWLNHLTRDPLMLRWFTLLLALLSGALIYRWVVRPILESRNAFVVDHVRPENANVATVQLRPVRSRHKGLNFNPGQFAWLRLDSPLRPVEEHPFTISSGAHQPRELAFTIRNSGDFSSTMTQLTPGRRVYVDGPYGDFTMDSRTPGSLVLISGGVGITPMMSMLRTLAHRHDPRPILLITAARSAEDLLFRQELDLLRAQLRLIVVEVLDEQSSNWTGMTGRVDLPLLDRLLPRQVHNGRCHVYLCGPQPMVHDVTATLNELGVPRASIHTELFHTV